MAMNLLFTPRTRQQADLLFHDRLDNRHAKFRSDSFDIVAHAAHQILERRLRLE